MKALTSAWIDTTGPVAELHIPASWQQIDLLSDLHLSENTPRTTDTFLDYLHSSTADAILLLGDILEVWVGDDVIGQGGFEQTLLSAIASASSGRWVGFMAGNRDFLLGPAACTAAHLNALPDPLLLLAWDQRSLLMHGDALCLADTDYQRFRSEVRSAQWQSDFLARPLPERIETGRRMRAASEARKAAHTPESYADVDAAASCRLMAQTQARTLIHGHTHRPASQTWGPNGHRHVLSDWDCEHAPARAEVIELRPEGLQRRSLQG
jgi:UDP-2,3-diacylglucosamine hydrolase